MKFKQLDTVVLECDLPESGLRKGNLGAVVQTYEPDGLEVEFLAASGRTQALVTIRVGDVRAAQSAQVSLAEALLRGPPPDGNLAVPIFAHGSLQVELYTLRGTDPQEPHQRDEVYLIAKGSGMFFNGVSRFPVATGSFLFVPAGQLHRFEDFSEDFTVWVVFYGPIGGEGAAEPR